MAEATLTWQRSEETSPSQPGGGGVELGLTELDLWTQAPSCCSPTSNLI